MLLITSLSVTNDRVTNFIFIENTLAKWRIPGSDFKPERNGTRVEGILRVVYDPTHLQSQLNKILFIN